MEERTKRGREPVELGPDAEERTRRRSGGGGVGIGQNNVGQLRHIVAHGYSIPDSSRLLQLFLVG